MADIRLALIPDHSAHGIWDERGDHGVIQHTRAALELVRSDGLAWPWWGLFATIFGLGGGGLVPLQGRLVIRFRFRRVVLGQLVGHIGVIMPKVRHRVQSFLARPRLSR